MIGTDIQNNQAKSNMKKLLLLLLLMGSLNYAFSQTNDLIVLENGDSIHCNIKRLSKKKIRFKLNGEKGQRNCVVDRSEVKHVEFNTLSLPKGELNAFTSNKFRPKHDRFSIAASYGIAQKLNMAFAQPDDLKDLEEKLMAFEVYQLEATYYWKGNMGMGLNFQRGYTSHNSDFIYQNERFYFVGPQFSYRKYLKNQNTMFYCKLSAGVLNYKKTREKDDLEMYIKGNTFCIGGTLGFEHKLSKYIGLGLNADIFGGNISNLKSGGEPLTESHRLKTNESISLSRIGLSGGLRLYL